jgi:hypothetical protein
MKNIINVFVYVLGIIILLDMICFCAWVASGQIPQDGFFFGRITKEILAFIL